MQILARGGAGYIGSHPCSELLQAGYEVVVDNLSNSKVESLKRVERVAGRSLCFYRVDLLNKAALASVFRGHEIDAVIHFAGLKAVGESSQIPVRCYHNNITGTLMLCEVMEEFGVKTIVFSSSATVYGNPQKVPITEDFPLSATNPYGRTKLLIEEILRDVRSAEPGLVIYNLGTGCGYSVLEAIAAFSKTCGKPISYKIVVRREGDVAISYADPSLAQRELGWLATKGLAEMCADTWRWQAANPSGYADSEA